GGNHTLAIRKDGTLWAWGYGGTGALGRGNYSREMLPAVVVSLLSRDWIGVAAGGLHSVALRDDGTVWTWGSNNVGQLGYYPLSNTALPGQVTGIPEIVS